VLLCIPTNLPQRAALFFRCHPLTCAPAFQAGPAAQAPPRQHPSDAALPMQRTASCPPTQRCPGAAPAAHLRVRLRLLVRLPAQVHYAPQRPHRPHLDVGSGDGHNDDGAAALRHAGSGVRGWVGPVRRIEQEAHMAEAVGCGA
jgi:hypothetical protein